MTKVWYQVLKLAILGCIVWYAYGTLSKPKSKKSKKDKAAAAKIKLSQQTVHERGLVSEKVKTKDITDNYANYCEKTAALRNFSSGSVLGYVTPWNSHGYDVAKSFKKFTMISPVWLQIKRKPRGKYNVQGTHDVDQGWMEELRKRNSEIQILPRVLFDGWSLSDFNKLFGSEDEIEDMIDVLADTLIDYDFDGMVLEMWSQLPPHSNQKAIHVISHISEAFRQRDLTFILVIPPPVYYEGKGSSVTAEEFQRIEPMVDAFSLMTYDYMATAPPGRAGPTAPLVWIETCVHMLDPHAKARHKIMLGLNFYGYLYGKNRIKAIVGNEYIQMLKSRTAQIEWNKDFGEHIVLQDASDGSTQVIFYPTLMSIQRRIELARELGTGIAIWDIGQGLDYFYDLL